MDAFISTNEAAARLGITRQRVLQLIKGGRLPAEKFANVYMIRPADLKQVEDRPQGRPPGKVKTAKEAILKGEAKKGGKK